jgi:hypothetical protein
METNSRCTPVGYPLLMGPPSLLLRFRIPPWALRPHTPHSLARVLWVPVPSPSVLDNVHTPASAAPVSPSLLNPGTPPREDLLYIYRNSKRY